MMTVHEFIEKWEPRLEYTGVETYPTIVKEFEQDLIVLAGHEKEPPSPKRFHRNPRITDNRPDVY